MADLTATRILLFGGTALVALATATAASAQTAATTEAASTSAATPANAAAPEDAEAIVVTGYRASLAKSLLVKRNLDVVAEIITAEDIGRLPDVSIAESLARLPGVTSQRTGGQASAINIRGLSQDLVSATLNGREQVATSGNRTIEFDQYPSELINQAAVYKSPKASQIEGGIAGKVELTTARPLSLDKTVVSVNVRGQFNDRAKQSPDADKFGYRASASIQTQLLDNTLGIALGYARLRQANVATRFVGYDYAVTGQSGSPTATDRNGDGRPDSIGYGFEATQFGGNETRDGVLGTIQYEPDDSFRVLLDGYWSQFKSDVSRRGLRFENLQSSSDVLTNPTIVNNAIVGGTVANPGLGGPLTTRTVQQDESRKDKLYTFGGNIAKDFGRLTLAVDATYSRGTSYFNNAGLNSNTTAFDASGNPTPLGLTYQLNDLKLADFSTNFDYTNPAGNQIQGFYIVPQYDTDRLYAFAGSATYRVEGSFLKSLEVGVRYANRRARRTITSYDGFDFNTALGGPVTLDSSNSSIGGFSGKFARYPDFLVADINKIFDARLGKNRVVGQGPGQTFTQDQSFTIDEKTWAGYGQLNFDTIAGSLPFKGNIGLRVVHTDQGSASTVDNPASSDPLVRDVVQGGKKFTDFLPSANLILSLSDNDQARLSLSRQISRTRFFDLRGSISTNLVGTGNGTARIDGSGGNPTLNPYRANQVDMTFEHYMGRSGALIIGAYYKDIRSFVIGGTVPNYDFAAAGITTPPDSLSLYPNGVTPVGNLSAPINGKGGYVYGFEAALTKTFTFLPSPLDGFGVSANIAYSKSAVNFTSSLSGNSLSISLPGLSKIVSNPTVFYEKAGFGARVGMRYRSKFVAPQIGLNEQIVTNAAETVFDAQVSYEFPAESALRGLTLLAQANNFTDEPTRSYFGQQAQTGTIQYFGRQFYLGASLRF